MRQSLKKYLKNQEDPLQVYTKQLMYWANASFLKNKVNDRVIIENIDKKPKKVIFEKDEDKVSCTTNSNYPQKEWQNLAYIVDVEVSYIQNNPKVYKVIKVYTQETYDPEDERIT